MQKYVRKYAFILLFLLGGFQILYALTCILHAYAFQPVFARTFAVSSFTPEQRQVYFHFISDDQSQWLIVGFFGVATIVLGILLLITGSRKVDAPTGSTDQTS